MFKTYEEPESPNEGACVRYMMNPNRQMGGGVGRVSDPESPNEGAACVRYMMNRNRQMKGGVFKISDEPESRKRGRVQDT